MQPLRTILARRHALRSAFDVHTSFASLEESCIPSYVHPNVFASGVAWLRLLTAARLFNKYGETGPVLDFGAGSGEMYHLLDTAEPYYFVEANDALAQALLRWNSSATRLSLENLSADRFAAVFALDALEHNAEVADLIVRLVASLRPGGILLLSGPTENLLYRLGRRVAGFGGHYHLITVGAIEEQMRKLLKLRHQCNVPLGLPLFRLSVWTRLSRQAVSGGL